MGVCNINNIDHINYVDAMDNIDAVHVYACSVKNFAALELVLLQPRTWKSKVCTSSRV
jgi:hypothetical protein